MKGTIRIAASFRRWREFEVCTFLSVVTLCLPLAYGTLGLAQVPGQTQRNALAPGAELAAAPPSVLKAREESLRKRAEEFYALLQSGRVDQAERYIAPDSKENFRKERKGSFFGFKVDSIKLQPDGREATVVVQMQVMMGNMGRPVTMPLPSHWTWVDGLWYLAVPEPAKQGENAKALFKAPATGGQAPPEELKFKIQQYRMGKIPPGQVTVARFPFTNVTDHTVTLSSVNTFCDCLQVKAGKKEFKPGESGELDIEFDPKGYAQTYAQSILIKTDPGDLTAHLSVIGYVVPPPKESSKPKTSCCSAP
jgi:hypothetical protein